MNDPMLVLTVATGFAPFGKGGNPCGRRVASIRTVN